MPFVPLSTEIWGIGSLFAARPDLGKPLCELAEALLRGPSSLSPAERELIATRVSAVNRTQYCQLTHGAAAAALWGEGGQAVADAVRHQVSDAPLSPKLRALMALAEQVTESGLSVTQACVDAARAEGATDDELHQSVAIAAAFCMYNRYVDGLRTASPDDPTAYGGIGHAIAQGGYLRDRPGVPSFK